MSPDSPELADGSAALRSAYVHIPFCERVCPYCDFTVVAGRDDLYDRYLEAVIAEIDAEMPWGPLDSVFVGGGTPSKFGADRLNTIVTSLRDRFAIAAGAEISLEANPEDWTLETALELRAGGFNRVSFGAQSFEPEVLAYLGRIHGPDDIAAAVESARSGGFESVNLDLIFGSPCERDWRGTVMAALDLSPDHLSAYALTVERGTPLSRAVAAGAPAPDADDQAAKWELASSLAEAAGLVRYEVSNFARPGHHCRYNLGVWAQGEYLGFGVGAHGFRNGVRRRNVRRVEAYLERVGRGVGPVQGTEDITGWAAEQERLMLGLRLAAGVSRGHGGRRLLETPSGKRLLEAGVLIDGERLSVARPLLTDVVARAVLDLGAPEDWLSVSHPER